VSIVTQRPSQSFTGRAPVGNSKILAFKNLDHMLFTTVRLALIKLWIPLYSDPCHLWKQIYRDWGRAYAGLKYSCGSFVGVWLKMISLFGPVLQKNIPFLQQFLLQRCSTHEMGSDPPYSNIFQELWYYPRGFMISSSVLQEGAGDRSSCVVLPEALPCAVTVRMEGALDCTH
jgi:hypothetical protein